MTISTLWTIWKDSDIDDTQIIFNDQIIPVKVVEGWFEIFKKKGWGGGLTFFHKKGGVGEIGEIILKKGVSLIIYFHTN